MGQREFPDPRAVGYRLLLAAPATFPSVVIGRQICDRTPVCRKNFGQEQESRAGLEPYQLAHRRFPAAAIPGTGASVQTAAAALFLCSRSKYGMGRALSRWRYNLRTG